MEKIIDPRCFWKEQVVTRVRFYRRRKFQRNKFLEGRYDSYYPFLFLLAEARQVSLSMINYLVSTISSRALSSTRFNTVGRRSNESPWNIILVPFASDLPRVFF